MTPSPSLHDEILSASGNPRTPMQKGVDPDTELVWAIGDAVREELRPIQEALSRAADRIAVLEEHGSPT